jgi:hypothetical protein
MFTFGPSSRGASAPPTPILAASAATGFAFVSGQSLTMPSGIVAGDLLVAVLSTYSYEANSYAGWTFVASETSTPTRLVIVAKIAAGGDTLTTGMPGTAWASGLVMRITGCDSLAKLYASSSAISSTTTPDSPAVTPAGGDSNYLVIPVLAWSANASNLSSGPSGYGTPVQTSNPDSSNKTGSAFASAQLAGSSFDPSTWAITVACNCSRFTLAARG